MPSTTTPVGPIVVAFLLPLIPSFFFANSYSNPSSSSPGVIALLVLSYSLTATACLLLPLDLSYTAASIASADDATSAKFYSGAIMASWQTTFWTTFLLAWGILPLTQDYVQSGFSSRKLKLVDALRTNAKFYVVSGAVGVLVILIMMMAGGGVSVIDFLMAAGNTYGLLLVVVLLGHGLVAVPKVYFAKADPARLVTRRYLLASTLDTDLYEAVWDLQDVEDCVDAVLRRKQGVTGLPLDMLNDLQFLRESGVADLTADPSISARRTRSSRGESTGTASSSTSGLPLLDPGCDLTEKNLASLTATLRRRQLVLRQAVVCRDCLVEEVRYYSMLSEGAPPRPEPLRFPGEVSCPDIVLARLRASGDWATYYWRLHLRKPACVFAGVVFSCMSAMVLWSELAMGFPVSLSPFGQLISHTLHSSDGRPSYFVEMISLLPLLYTSWCVYSSLLSVRLFSRYGLKSKKRSSGPALMFSASYLVRMQFPLCYNYLLFLRYNASEYSAFTGLMKNMDTIPVFGTSFSVYAPLITVLLSLATFFNWYGRLLAKLGVDHEDAVLFGGDAEEYEMRLREGKTLLARRLAATEPTSAVPTAGADQTGMEIGRTGSNGGYSKV